MNHHPDYHDRLDCMEAADDKDEGYAPRERPFDVAAYMRKQREMEVGAAEKIQASYQERVKRRAELKKKWTPSDAAKETGRADVTTGLPTGAKGQPLLDWEKKGVTWTVQLVAQELPTGFKISLIRIQPWRQTDGHLVVINGPGCGLSLGTKEAEALIGALQAGVKKIKSKEFNPRVEGNFVPCKRNQK